MHILFSFFPIKLYLPNRFPAVDSIISHCSKTEPVLMYNLFNHCSLMFVVFFITNSTKNEYLFVDILLYSFQHIFQIKSSRNYDKCVYIDTLPKGCTSLRSIFFSPTVYPAEYVVKFLDFCQFNS